MRRQEATTGASEALADVCRTLATVGAVAPIGLWVCRPDGTWPAANATWHGIVGVDRPCEDGAGWGTTIHPEDAARVNASWQAFVAGDEDCWHEEFAFARPDGSLRHVSEDARRDRAEDGSVLRIIGSTLDHSEQREAELRMRRHLADAEVLAALLPSAVWRAEADGRVTQASERWREIGWQDPAAAEGEGWHAHVHPDDLPRVRAAWRTAVRDGTAYRAEYRGAGGDGDARQLVGLAHPVLDEDGRVDHFVGVIVDVTETRRTAELARRAARDGALARLGHLALDRANPLPLVYAEAVQLVADAIPGATCALLAADAVPAVVLARSTPAPPEPPPAAAVRFPVEVAGGRVAELVVGGALQVLDADDGAFLATVAQLLSSAIERSRAESAPRRPRRTDELTGLANRARLEAFIARALARREEAGGDLAILFVGLDGFADVNERLGHVAGDDLLRAVGRRLATLRRPGDVLARFGGDEFVLACEAVPGEADAVAIAERLVAEFRRPFQVWTLDGDDLHVTATVGVALAGDSYPSAERLLRDAQAAMRRGKARGGGALEVFDASTRELLVRRMQTESALRGAAERGEIEAFYQPIASAADGRLFGFEALARWRHPTRGLLPPSEFVAVAETSGLIVEIGGRMIDEACRQAAVWNGRDPAGPPLRVTVNVAAAQMARDGLVERVRAALAASGIAPSQLGLEITETALIDDPDAAAATLHGLRELGVSILLDDFGTGWSSLHHVRTFPIDAIKIDRSFVLGLGSRPADLAIIQAVAAMGSALGHSVVAEGVETADHLAAVRRAGCTHVQGYLLSRPMPAADTEELVRRRPSWSAA